MKTTIENKAVLRAPLRPAQATIRFLCTLAVAGGLGAGANSRAQAQQYVVTDLGTLGGSNSYGYGINREPLLTHSC